MNCLHKHKCDNCGHVWEHDGADIICGKLDTTKAHTCEKCGEEQYTIFNARNEALKKLLCQLDPDKVIVKKKRKTKFDAVKNSFMDLFS